MSQCAEQTTEQTRRIELRDPITRLHQPARVSYSSSRQQPTTTWTTVNPSSPYGPMYGEHSFRHPSPQTLYTNQSEYLPPSTPPPSKASTSRTHITARCTDYRTYNKDTATRPDKSYSPTSQSIHLLLSPATHNDLDNSYPARRKDPCSDNSHDPFNNVMHICRQGQGFLPKAMDVSFEEESSFFKENDISFNVEVNSEYDGHNDDNNNPQKKVYSCKDCNYKTYSSGNLSRHRRAVHQKVRFECSSCRKSYANSYDLREHTRSVHHGSRFMCVVYSRAYCSRKSLNTHIRCVHSSDAQKYHCSSCNKDYTNKVHYHGHVNKHMDLKAFTCSRCDKRFYYKPSLRKHQSTCQKGKVFTCDMCGKRLASRVTLKDHIAGKHGEKVNVCARGKAFPWLSSLFRHRGKCLVAKQAISQDK
ncbi:oocyte zinc finger protein XlCOF6-like [Mya arenaria]|uniref:oocyte zinc finger protein XlCOF6-like n=1 Tax=Mya arenaria TaxID=6604 RepID=UPI0022E6A6B8|nr:oocyte zinc finger protein XlCOF6-like [Mya arenaria]